MLLSYLLAQTAEIQYYPIPQSSDGGDMNWTIVTLITVPAVGALVVMVKAWLRQQEKLTAAQIASNKAVTDSQIENNQKVTEALIKQSTHQTEALVQTADNLTQLNRAVEEIAELKRKHTEAILQSVAALKTQMQDHTTRVTVVHEAQIRTMERMSDALSRLCSTDRAGSNLDGN